MNRSMPALPIAVLIAGLAASGAVALEDGDCLTCHEDQSLTRTGADGKPVSLYVDQTAFKASVHATNGCTSCHADVTEAPHPDGFKAVSVACGTCHAKASGSYEVSAHGVARRTGHPRAAGCADCHGTHGVQRPGVPSSPLNHAKLADTCGKCHAPIVAEVRRSVHGQAMAAGLTEAPTCTDCHTDHGVDDLRQASPMKIAAEVCSRCHASEKFNARFDLPANRVTTFFDSYHGLAARVGSPRAANCASCHGFHNILPSSDTNSLVNPRNLTRTCQKCHPGAGEKFVQGRVHLDYAVADDLGSRINQWVRRIYLTMIVGVLSGLAVHNLLAFRRKLILARQSMQRWVVRMPLHERVQHGLLVLSFGYLSISGFALKFPSPWILWLVGSDETVRRMGHRVAAVVMLSLATYHVVYMAATKSGRRLFLDFLPSLKDVVDGFGNLRYFLFPKAPKPRFGRFGYAEKLEYWAVVWGTIVMGVTGLLIWFKETITQWVPRWVVDVAITVHLYEAILAVLAIVVWHFYHIIFDPEVYPLNWAFWDGRVTEHWHREEHPLDTAPRQGGPAVRSDEEDAHGH